MNRTERIATYEVNLELSHNGSLIRGAAIMVGPPDVAGWRRKDGPIALEFRHLARAAVLAELELDPRWTTVATGRRSLRVCARYSRLVPLANGAAAARDPSGRTVGVYGPREGGAR
jgi:hypothetical protein